MDKKLVPEYFTAKMKLEKLERKFLVVAWTINLIQISQSGPKWNLTHEILLALLHYACEISQAPMINFLVFGVITAS